MHKDDIGFTNARGLKGLADPAGLPLLRGFYCGVQRLLDESLVQSMFGVPKRNLQVNFC